ncbi:hypothetical protein ACEWPM_015775 [Roseovarius sp. S4756]|uniref:hypothetical protein n=1 Tax=Roseovarius maritimus TaxID=3342637 RepID=UPI00372BE495
MSWPPKPTPGHNVDQTISRDEWEKVEVHGVEIEGIDDEGFLNVWRPEGGEPMKIDAEALFGLLHTHFGIKHHNPADD